MRVIRDIYGVPFLVKDGPPEAAIPVFQRVEDAEKSRWTLHSWRLIYSYHVFVVSQQVAEEIIGYDLQHVTEEARQALDDGKVPYLPGATVSAAPIGFN